MSSKFSRIPAIGRLLSIPLLLLLCAGCATSADPLGDQAVATRLRMADLARASASADTIAAKQLFIRGMRFEMEADYEHAIEHYTRALTLVPEQPAVLMAMAEAHRELNDVDAARAYARQAHLAEPDNLEYHQQYADLLLHTGDSERAIEVYADLVARHPDAYEALYDLARIQTQVGQLREALQTYQRVLDVLGEDTDVRTEMLHVYIRLADGAGIVSTLEAMVEAEPYNTSYLRMLAEAHVQNDEPARAVGLLMKAHDLEPEDFSLVVKLADVYRTLGQEAQADSVLAAASEESHSIDALLAQASAYYARAGVDEESGSTAEQLLNRVLELDPNNADAALMLGSMRFQEGAYAEAATHFDAALKVHDGQVQVWFQAAAAHLQAGDAARAAQMADEGLVLFPGQVDLLRIAGYAYMERFENALAIARFETLLHVLLEDEPDATELQADVLSALAMIHDRQQDTGASDSLYARAIVANPDHSLSLNNYAYSLAERNEKLDEALAMAKRAVELEPENPSFLDTLGWVYFQMREYEEAHGWIVRSVEAGSRSAAVFEHLGDVLLKLGDPEAARSRYSEALDLGGDSERIGEKIERTAAN